MKEKKFFKENESKINFEYRQEILKKFELSDIQKLIKKKYEHMEDNYKKYDYFIYEYLELPSIGPKNYFGDLAFDFKKSKKSYNKS